MIVNFNNVYNIFLKSKIRKIFALSLKENKTSFDYSVNITFVSENEIRGFNKQFRNIDKATDVLSFPMYEKGEQEERNPKTNHIDLGDIIICKPYAKLQAKKLGHSKSRELCFLSLHGMLHLMGYDHIEKEDEAVMIKMQKKILYELNIRR